jgi:hypothetical protein
VIKNAVSIIMLNHQVQLSFSFLNFFFIQLLHIFCLSSSIQCTVPSTYSNTNAEGTGVHLKMRKNLGNSIENTSKHGLNSEVAINYMAIEWIFHANFNHPLHIHKPRGITVLQLSAITNLNYHHLYGKICG